MTKSGLVIREAATTDVRECAELIAAEGSDDVEQWLQRFSEMLQDPDRRFLIAVVDETVVAFGHLRYVGQSSRPSRTGINRCNSTNSTSASPEINAAPDKGESPGSAAIRADPKMRSAAWTRPRPRFGLRAA